MSVTLCQCCQYGLNCQYYITILVWLDVSMLNFCIWLVSLLLKILLVTEFVSMMTHVNAVEDFTRSKMSEFVSMMTCVDSVEDFTSDKLSEFVSMITCVDSVEIFTSNKQHVRICQYDHIIMSILLKSFMSIKYLRWSCYLNIFYYL